jgi:hypothetical protein
MTYKDIYAAVNRVKPCRFTANHGTVTFELIWDEGEPTPLAGVVENLQELGAGFSYDGPYPYHFPGGRTQWRTLFKVTKAKEAV